jgi:hypothetical protein
VTLADLLDELREGILHDVSNQIAGGSDKLWSDTRLVRYIDEAQRRFAREGLVIRDGSTAKVCQVPLVATSPVPTPGQNIYPLDPSVIAVISARLESDPADLARAGHSAFNTYRQPDTYFFNPSWLTSLPPGKPLAYSTDEYVSADAGGSQGIVNLRIYPAPNYGYNGQNILLRVVRMPIIRLTIDDLQVVPEIPEEHHMDMLDWAAYLALRKVDIDANDDNRADKFRASFEAHVAEAKKIVLRKLFTPLQWGFGRNGFSWEGN